VLIGDDGPNGLIGGDGDDVIDGAGGDDVVEGDAGMDEVDGGPGTDYFSSYGSPTAVTINLVTGTSMGADPSTDSDTLSNIEDVQGSPFDDTIIGNDGPNALRGDPGADTISGGDGDDILIGDCAGAPPHLYIEDAFDCSSPDHPDHLDGGAGADLCLEGETDVSCESTTANSVRFARADRRGWLSGRAVP
jgi:Ca2+-binding RTX toxin-like protein